MQGASLPRASAPNSSSIFRPRRSACSSRKEPVPAAQTLFMVKSTTAPFSSETYLASCPPISKMVSTRGSACTAPRAWVVISLRTASAPMDSPVRYRPLPVVTQPRTTTRSPTSRPTS